MAIEYNILKDKYDILYEQIKFKKIKYKNLLTEKRYDELRLNNEIIDLKIEFNKRNNNNIKE